MIPSAIRDRAGLVAGAELEITIEESVVRLERVASAPHLVKVGRRLVARPTAAADVPSIDVSAIVEEERNRWP